MEFDSVKYNEISELLKAIAHPVRLCIVKGLIENGGCNVSHMQSCLEIPQSTLSQHIQKLKAAGILEGTRSGIEINYRVSNPLIEPLISVLFGK